MLILSRKIGEAITFGEHIRVVVLGINGKQVRLGIEAPTGLVVLREEIAPHLPQEEPQEP